MTFRYCDENSATRCTNFSARGECPFNGRAVVRQIDNLCGKKHRIIRWRWSEQFDCILRCDGARRVILFRALHQMIGRRPIAMAIEQRADDAAIQNALKSFVFFLWFPLCNDFAVLRETANVQPIRIRRSATPAGVVWRIFFLERLRVFHCSGAL